MIRLHQQTVWKANMTIIQVLVKKGGRFIVLKKTKEKGTKGEKAVTHKVRAKSNHRRDCFDAQRMDNLVGAGARWRTHCWWLGCHGLKRLKILELLYVVLWGE